MRKHLNTCGEFSIADFGEFLTAIYNYYNYKRMHMSLYEDRIITPGMAYEMKKLKKGEVLE